MSEPSWTSQSLTRCTAWSPSASRVRHIWSTHLQPVHLFLSDNCVTSVQLLVCQVILGIDSPLLHANEQMYQWDRRLLLWNSCRSALVTSSFMYYFTFPHVLSNIRSVTWPLWWRQLWELYMVTQWNEAKVQFQQSSQSPVEELTKPTVQLLVVWIVVFGSILWEQKRGDSFLWAQEQKRLIRCCFCWVGTPMSW